MSFTVCFLLERNLPIHGREFYRARTQNTDLIHTRRSNKCQIRALIDVEHTPTPARHYHTNGRIRDSREKVTTRTWASYDLQRNLEVSPHNPEVYTKMTTHTGTQAAR